jgi:hypothetical protein
VAICALSACVAARGAVILETCAGIHQGCIAITWFIYTWNWQHLVMKLMIEGIILLLTLLDWTPFFKKSIFQ